MKYMGGKGRIAKQLVSAILSDVSDRADWREPFVGGGNVVEHAAPHFDRCVGTDVHPDLIMLWQHLASGADVPSFFTRERYEQLRCAEPSWERGLAGFAASFGGKWFGGYGAQKIDAKHPTDHVYYGSLKTIRRQAEVMSSRGVIFACGSYADFAPPAGAVIYCDPPYAGTTKYDGVNVFDHEVFYARCLKWAETCSVFVSEYALPDAVPSRIVWEMERRNSLSRNDNLRTATERLFRIGVVPSR